MTTTPLDYFDKTLGTLEQIVLGIVTQKLINRDYIHQSLATDFTTNAITYDIALDSGENLSIDGNFTASLTFPTVPFERQILTDRDSFELRILSLNSLTVDTFSLPQKPDYPIKSAVPTLPLYLSEPIPDNTLERRLMALCLYVRAYLNWIERWNQIANYWIATTIENKIFVTYPLIDIEADRDEMLLELENGVTYKPIPIIRIFTPPTFSFGGDPSTAQEQIDSFGSGDEDPANSGGSPMSANLASDLQEAASGAGDSPFGGNSPDSPQQKEPESPTLPNC